MTPHDIPVELREAIYTHEVLRVAGIPSDDIYMSKLRDGLAVVVKRAGQRDVAVAGIPSLMPDAMFLTLWPRVVELWNRTCNDADAGWDLPGSLARRNAVAIMAAVA